MRHAALFQQASSCHFLCAAGALQRSFLLHLHCRWCGLLCQAFVRILQSCHTRWIANGVQAVYNRINWVGIARCSGKTGVHLGTKGGAFLESIRQYFKRTDKIYLLLCIFSSTMAVVALASWAAKQGNGFATDEITGAITGIGDYRRALVQAAAAGLGIVIALLLSCIDYRSLVKVWPVHVALTWGLVLPTLFIRNVAIGPLTIGFNAGDTDNYSWYKLGGFTFQPTELQRSALSLPLPCT